MDIHQIQTEILAHLVGLGREGGMSNVMVLVKNQMPEYQKAFDIANEMQNLDWIKIIYCSPQTNIINVELTLKGKQEFARRLTRH